jgi:hypothetical protein
MKSLYPNSEPPKPSKLKTKLQSTCRWISENPALVKGGLLLALAALVLLYIFPVLQVGLIPDTRQWNPKLQTFSGDSGGIYRLNRLTGSIHVLRGNTWEKPIFKTESKRLSINVGAEASWYNHGSSVLVTGSNQTPYELTGIAISLEVTSKSAFPDPAGETAKKMRKYLLYADCQIPPYSPEFSVSVKAPNQHGRLIDDWNWSIEAIYGRKELPALP